MRQTWGTVTIRNHCREIAQHLYRPGQPGWYVWLAFRPNSEQITATVNTASTKPNPKNWGAGELLILETWTEGPNGETGTAAVDAIDEWIFYNAEQVALSIYRRDEMPAYVSAHSEKGFDVLCRTVKECTNLSDDEIEEAIQHAEANAEWSIYLHPKKVDPKRISQIETKLDALAMHYETNFSSHRVRP